MVHGSELGRTVQFRYCCRGLSWVGLSSFFTVVVHGFEWCTGLSCVGLSSFATVVVHGFELGRTVQFRYCCTGLS